MSNRTFQVALATAALLVAPGTASAAQAADAAPEARGEGWSVSSLFGFEGDREAPPPAVAAVPAERSATQRVWDAMTRNPFSGGRAQDAQQWGQVARSLEGPDGPPTPELRRALARLAEARGEVDAARAQLTAALELDGEDTATLRDIGRLEDRHGRLDLAEKAYRRAVALAPNNAAALNDLALCCARQGKLQESAAHLEAAVRVQPEKLLYRNNIAKVLVELDAPEAALAHLSAAHSPAAAHYNLGWLLAARGDTAGAAQSFRQALAIQPNLTGARAALEKLQGEAHATHVAAASAAPSARRAPAQHSADNRSTTPGLPPLDGAKLPQISPAYPRMLPPVD